MKNKKRIQKLLAEFAPILGSDDCGEDANGNKYKFGKDKEARQKQHLFYIKNKELENVSGEFVLGHVIPDIIRDDCYEVVYLGPHNNPNRMLLGKLQKQVERDLAAGKQAKRERMGIFDLTEATPVTIED